MLKILKELINLIMNDPLMCVLFNFCFAAMLVCCVVGCVIMLLDSFYEPIHKKKVRKKKVRKKKAKRRYSQIRKLGK